MSIALAPSPELIWFSGGDAVKFLNDLISQEISDLEPDSVKMSLLLGPQGKLDFILWVLKTDDRIGLLTEDGRGEELIARLGRYRIRVDVEIEPEQGGVFLVVGDTDVPPGRLVKDGRIVAANLSWPNLDRELRIGGEKPDLDVMDPDAYVLSRIDAGIPVFDVDVDEKTIPQETDLVPATISFNKGCFLGQELVARLDSRGGRVNRHLRILDFADPVATGTTLSNEEKEVGTVTSSSGEKGLALVWRDVEPGDVLDAGGVKAIVRETPQKTA